MAAEIKLYYKKEKNFSEIKPKARAKMQAEEINNQAVEGGD